VAVHRRPARRDRRAGKHLRDHLIASGKSADPIQRARFASCIVGARGAGEWVRRAAQMAEAQSDDSVAFVLMTRGIFEEAGLAMMDAAARAVGTAAFSTGNPVDRITRDLGLYLRQPVPDQARDRAAAAWIEADRWERIPGGSAGRTRVVEAVASSRGLHSYPLACKGKKPDQPAGFIARKAHALGRNWGRVVATCRARARMRRQRSRDA
jgi:hypothetical protein